MNAQEFSRKDSFAASLGIELLEASDGRARAKLEIKEAHLNGVQIAHGGAIFSLADFAFAAASNSRGNTAVAINVHAFFLKAVHQGAMLFAEAQETSFQPKLATYSIQVTDQTGELVADFQGMAYRKTVSQEVLPKIGGSNLCLS